MERKWGNLSPFFFFFLFSRRKEHWNIGAQQQSSQGASSTGLVRGQQLSGAFSWEVLLEMEKTNTSGNYCPLSDAFMSVWGTENGPGGRRIMHITWHVRWLDGTPLNWFHWIKVDFGETSPMEKTRQLGAAELCATTFHHSSDTGCACLGAAVRHSQALAFLSYG